MSFSDFQGNSEVIHRLRDMLARNRFPQAVILAGPAGSGKYTLALMLAKAMNCLSPPSTEGLPDFCGRCSNCLRIGRTGGDGDQIKFTLFGPGRSEKLVDIYKQLLAL